MEEQHDKKLQEYNEFENLIYECTEESLEIAKRHTMFNNKVYTQTLISIVSLSKPFSYKILGDLFNDSLPVARKFTWGHAFLMYLYRRGILSKDDFEEKELVNDEETDDIDKSENPFKEGSMWDIIKNDDVKRFVEYVQTEGTEIENEEIYANGAPMDVFCFAAFFGSINIIKNLVLTGFKPSECALEIAYECGKEEVIEYLLSYGIKIENNEKIRCLIKGHQPNILQWTIEDEEEDSIEDKENQLIDCVTYCDTISACQLLKSFNQKVDDDLLDYLYETAETYNNEFLMEITQNIF